VRLDPPTCLAPHDPPRLLPPPLPEGTCDCHCHVFGPTGSYPLFAGRSYTPSIVTLDDYAALMDSFGMARGIVVQPSVYGTDNAVLLDALARRPDRLRGVAVLPREGSDAELRQLHDRGVRGLRINLLHPGIWTLADVVPLSRKLARMGMHIELLVSLEDDAVDVRSVIDHSEVATVIGHFGLARSRQGVDRLLSIACQPTCWIKLSAPYRLGPLAFDLADVTARLLEVAAERLLWGTDWPHTECYEVVPRDDDLVALVQTWLPTVDARRQVLVDNPADLYWTDRTSSA
jgi:2-pyrone-4,6-dicarboxylate lactonase